jgi:hypothetical protein
MIRRCGGAAVVETKLGSHSFLATGITTHLKNGGSLEKTAAMEPCLNPHNAALQIAGARRLASMRSRGP